VKTLDFKEKNRIIKYYLSGGNFGNNKKGVLNH